MEEITLEDKHQDKSVLSLEGVKTKTCFVKLNKLIAIGDEISIEKQKKAFDSKDQSYSCIVCHKKFKQKAHLKTHYAQHTGEKRYKCSICDKRFIQNTHLKIHFAQHTGEKRFNCSGCNKRFNQSIHYKRHIRKCTFPRAVIKVNRKDVTQEKLATVPDKSFSTTPNKSLHPHVRPKKKSKKSLDQYGSTIDAKTEIMSDSAMNAKYGESTKDDPASANNTSAAYMNTKQLTRDAKVRKFKCNVCGKGFTRADSLTIHFRLHTGERPYKCSYCDLAFTQGGHLRSHEVRHTGEKKYSCNKCQKRFFVSGSLKQHLKKCSYLTEEVSHLQHEESSTNRMVSSQARSENKPNKPIREHTGVISETGVKQKVNNLANSVKNDQVSTDGEKTCPPSNLEKGIVSSKKISRPVGRPKKKPVLNDSMKYLVNEKYVSSVDTNSFERSNQDKAFSTETSKDPFDNGEIPMKQTGNTRAHSKKRPFTCQTCGKVFKFKSNFCRHKHIQNYDEENTNIPGKIRKAYIQVNKLKIDTVVNGSSDSDKTTHTNSRGPEKTAHRRGRPAKKPPVSCELCGKSFPHTFNLKIHTKKKHGKESFKHEKGNLDMPSKLENTVAFEKEEIQSDSKGLLRTSDDVIGTAAKTIEDSEIPSVRKLKDNTDHKDDGILEKTKLEKAKQESHVPQKQLSLRSEISNFSGNKDDTEPLDGGREDSFDDNDANDETSNNLANKIDTSDQMIEAGERLDKAPEGANSVMDVDESGQDKLSCPVCKKVFTSQPYVRVHMLYHLGIKPFSCRRCGKSFTQKSNLVTHMKIQHRLKLSRKKLALREKLAGAASDKAASSRQPSDKPSRKPSDKPSRRRPTKNPSGNPSSKKPDGSTISKKQYGKKSDNKASSNKEQGYLELSSSSSVEKIKCSICQKSISPSSLKIHMRQHTGEKPYLCIICEKPFCQINGLDYHMKRHHEIGMKPSSLCICCKICSKFVSGKDVYVHMRKHKSTSSNERDFDDHSKAGQTHREEAIEESDILLEESDEELDFVKEEVGPENMLQDGHNNSEVSSRKLKDTRIDDFFSWQRNMTDNVDGQDVVTEGISGQSCYNLDNIVDDVDITETKLDPGLTLSLPEQQIDEDFDYEGDDEYCDIELDSESDASIEALEAEENSNNVPEQINHPPGHVANHPPFNRTDLSVEEAIKFFSL